MWTAVALALTYGVLFGAYARWAAGRMADGVAVFPLVAGAFFVWLAVPFTFACIWFALAWWFRSERPERVRMPLHGVARMFWREFVSIAGNAPRMIFYRLLMPEPPAAPAMRPVLLLHGVLCNAGVWHPFRRYLASRGIGPVYALSYGPPLGSIEDFADQMATEIDAILAETGARDVIVVAHSMGGLVARAYLRKSGGAKVRRLITVGTPHAGSVHAYLFPGVSLSQMRPGNRWLGELAPPPPGAAPPIVSLWSWHDSMVAPQTSSRIDFGENVELVGIGHNALLTDPAVAASVAEEIRRA
jgi:hypothetical protein